jgi:hypothetical protein
VSFDVCIIKSRVKYLDQQHTRPLGFLTTWVIKPGRVSEKAGLCPVNEPILVCDIVPRALSRAAFEGRGRGEKGIEGRGRGMRGGRRAGSAKLA